MLFIIYIKNIGRSDIEAETPIVWPPDAKSWLIGKDPDAGKDWGQEEKGTTEDEMVGWYHRFDIHGFGWTLGVNDGQGGLACCSSWGRKESDTTEWLNWTELERVQLFVWLCCFLAVWLQAHYLKSLCFQVAEPDKQVNSLQIVPNHYMGTRKQGREGEREKER